jgi:hypothetical protein
MISDASASADLQDDIRAGWQSQQWKVLWFTYLATCAHVLRCSSEQQICTCIARQVLQNCYVVIRYTAE